MVPREDDGAKHMLQLCFKSEVADFKRLRGGVRFLAELPKTPTGKVSRRALRELARADPADT